jgi:hypothetical protein
MPPNITAHVT